MPNSSAQSKTTLEIILEWSRDRPAWQRDALRRIVQGRKLTEIDFAELVVLCKRGRTEKPPEDGPTTEPLEASHLPATPGKDASAALLAIMDVLGVNQLAPDQVLSFAANGITVVYGDNGAGKSGYARLLKRACRARHSEVILPNVYAGSATTTASATLSYSIGGAVQAPEQWQDTGKPAPQPHSVLSAISVFDADCAAVHLKDKNPVAFRPFGLDVPDELGVACKQVKALLDAEKKQQEGTRNAIFAASPWRATTVAGRAIAALTHKTNVLTLEKLAALTAQEHSRLTQLTEDLSKNPVTAAAEQKLKADRIKHLADALAVISTGTSDDVLAQLQALHSDATAKREASRLAALGLFGAYTLPAMGGEVWRALWEAARRYSTEIAYPVAPFPPAAPGMVCVLCQQPLSNEAMHRMSRFESFIRDDTERHAQGAEAAFAAAAGKLDKLVVSLQPIADGLKEIALHNSTISRAIRRALASARQRRYAVRRHFAGDEASAIPAAEPFPAQPIAAMEAEVRKYAADLEKTATGDERKALEVEQHELSDRALLNTYMAAIRAEVERLKVVHFLNDCLADTTTNAITNLGNVIADQVLTPRLRGRFSTEIIGLVGVNIRVEMVRAGGQYGSPHYQIRLLAKPDAKIPDILSEGEQTCVAIAAFLAELATAPHNSALVFGVYCPTNAIYWLTDCKKGAGKTLVVTNLSDTGKKKLRPVTAAVEPTFVHDLVRGKDVGRWRWETATKIILPQDPTHPSTAVPVDTLKVKFPKTFAFFKGFEKEIRACALLAQFFNPKVDPFYSSYNVGGYTYAPFKVVWKEICQEIESVVIEDPDRSVIPDHKLVMVAFDKAEPAYFLSGLLNSIPVGLFVRSYAVQTSISGHIFDYVAFPQFDSKDATHRDIAKHARDLHSAKAVAIAELEEKLDQVVALALQIHQANLKVMRKELQILRGGAVAEAA